VNTGYILKEGNRRETKEVVHRKERSEERVYVYGEI
jgi:hypothetical protein